MQFIRKEIVLEEAPETFLNLLRHIVHRQEINVEKIVQEIDKRNLYAEISGKGKTNFFSIGFFENYERNDTTDIVAFCPQIKITHQTEDDRITVYFYKESHPILVKQTKLLQGESKLVEIADDELRYFLEEADELTSV